MIAKRVVVIFFLAMLPACQSDPALPNMPSIPDLAYRPRDLAAPGPDYGRCFEFARHLPGGGSLACESDIDCRNKPWLPITCQEGMCCSGTLDPATCECRCQGVACSKDEWACCAGVENNRSFRTPPDLGVVMCRPGTDCEPYGP